MLPKDVDAILRAPNRRAIAFNYEKDHYALDLLSLVIGGGRPICDLRKGPYARLLCKPIVQPALARASRGVLTPACLREIPRGAGVGYPITFARWGGTKPQEWRECCYQTSRPGQNLVVQLNFPKAHDLAYRKLVQPGDEHPFVNTGHPARAQEPFTLAWARLDVDQEAGEVLIEEVQCDWVRNTHHYVTAAEHSLAAGEGQQILHHDELQATPAQLLEYVQHVLAPYARVWSECLLMATLQVIYDELSLRKVYFHTDQGGRKMKKLGVYGPPRSLYTDLPERFCFTRTQAPPRAFRKDRRVREWGVEWYELSMV